MSIENGISGPTAYACAALGAIMGDVFHSYRDGYRFSRLACDLVEKYGFIEYQARVYLAMSLTAHWTEPIGSAIEFNRLAYKRATESGDLTFAAHTNHQYLKCLLLRNDSLDVVWRESERVLDAARDAEFRDAEDLILNEQRFVAAMQGRTPAFPASGDPEGDEEVYEATLTDSRMPLMVCLYWTLKLKARYLFGDLAGALEALRRARRLVRSFVATIGQLDYSFYSALTVTALFESGSDEERSQWREHLAAQRDQLREWAETNPPTFADKYTVVLAEIARIEGRDVDAMRLYEQAIHLTRENGFIQNEALAHEVAARFYAVRGVETVANTYLRHARNCYDRWGAKGKVAQFDARHPRLQEEATPASFTATIGTPVRQLDVESVVKASQALSSEIVLPRLIETLMRLAVEHAGAERGLLILFRGEEPRIEAEATTGHESVAVTVRRTDVTPSDLPQSALHYVIRTRQRVLLDDASVGNLYSEDEYLRQKRTRSVLCVPIVTQTKLVGALYLENNLTPCAFTSDRVTVLELLASQAAISLENAGLYSDLQRGEAFLAEGQNISHTGSFGWNVANGEIYWSAETYNIFEHDRAVKPRLEMLLQRVHADDRDRVRQTLDRACETRADFDYEHRLLMADGSFKHLHVSARVLTTSSEKLEYVGAVIDVTAAKQAEEKIREQELEVRQIMDAAPQHLMVLGTDGSRLYANQSILEFRGLTFDDWQKVDIREVFYQDDAERVARERNQAILSGSPLEIEARMLRHDGKYRWFLVRYRPLKDHRGRITRWVVSAIDIDDRKRSEERLLHENVALREEIDKASMFEEIVGTSPPLQKVLSRISKVAPADSSVLITGETGTGKELVARAIHRRSRRSSRTFVSVNCAAIPRDLIASELFGHEKGAFTGATQQRLGRFELAAGGSIFLDEIGELPAETQIALLRVLQEHEFERVGGAVSIRTDVRLIAATNRDLDAAISAGTFRSDLFYRLNVFPIEIPPLRERREDIPMLVEYFIDRYARKAGKTFQALNKRSLDLLQSYSWPGNIRELQNVIERSLIVSSGDIFSVDEAWLSKESSQPPSQVQVLRPLEGESGGEREIIEAALAESRGRIAGPSGAAAKLQIPPSTLEYKIKTLKISKNQFKFR
jgi:PAS domain S-box-containing protein